MPGDGQAVDTNGSVGPPPVPGGDGETGTGTDDGTTTPDQDGSTGLGEGVIEGITGLVTAFFDVF